MYKCAWSFTQCRGSTKHTTYRVYILYVCILRLQIISIYERARVHASVQCVLNSELVLRLGLHTHTHTCDCIHYSHLVISFALVSCYKLNMNVNFIVQFYLHALHHHLGSGDDSDGDGNTCVCVYVCLCFAFISYFLSVYFGFSSSFNVFTHCIRRRLNHCCKCVYVLRNCWSIWIVESKNKTHITDTNTRYEYKHTYRLCIALACMCLFISLSLSVLFFSFLSLRVWIFVVYW